MSKKDRIYDHLHHFYQLLIDDFPRTGLISKGIYEVEQVYQAIEALPQDQEQLIRCEMIHFFKVLQQVQAGYQMQFNKEENLVLHDLEKEVQSF